MAAPNSTDYQPLTDKELDTLATITPQDIALSQQDAAAHPELNMLNALLIAQVTTEGSE